MGVLNATSSSEEESHEKNSTQRKHEHFKIYKIDDINV